MSIKMKRFLGILLSLALVLGLMPGMSLTAYAASSGKNGGFNWTLDDDGKMTVTGSGELPARFINQNGDIKSIVFDENCQVSGLTQNSIFCANNATEIIINSTADLTIAGSAIFWYSDSGVDPVSITINAPKVTIAAAEPFFAYDRQLNITVNTNELIVYNGTMSYLGRWNNSNNSFAYPANSTVYIPAGYVFADSRMQERYDQMAQYGDEDMFWQSYGEHLVKDRDYTYNEEASSVALTSENAGTVFGGAQTSSSNAYTAPHNHSFTYSASGATITATCGADGCTLPVVDNKPTATLTIAAPLHTTYGDGNEAAAVITDTNSIKGDAKVMYQTKSGDTYGTATETAPTDAGDYKASITVGGATASVEYTIAQADPTANAPTGLTATYGQTLTDVSLEGKNPEGNTPGTWAWVDSTKSVGNVVTPAATFKANFTPTSSNYKTVENVDVTVTVSKAANPATVTGTATVIKGGNTVDLSGNVTMNGATGEVSYAIDGETGGCSLTGSVLTSGDTTGTVTVNVTVAADDNYNALAATPITVTISDKGTQTITAADVTASYGDTDKSVSASVTDPAQGGGAISYAVKDGSADYIDVNATTGALTIKKVPSDGKAYIIVTAAGTAAYEQATKEVTVTINKANAVAATVAANNRSYDGTAKPLATVDDSTLVGGEMWYALGENATTAPADNLYTTSIPEKTDAGTYYVWYKAVGDENHIDSVPAYVTSVIKAEISAEVTFKVVNGSWDEGEGEAAIADKTVTLTGKEGDVLKLTAEQIPAVGSKPQDGYKAGNWDVTPSTETAITQATTYTYTYAAQDAAVVTKAPTAKELTANGQPQELVTEGTASDGTMQYAIGSDATNPPTSGWGTSIPKGTDAGTYYVWYKAVGDASHTDSVPVCVTVTIQKEEKKTISATVTFKVVHGAWGDGTTADKTVTLTGYEGDELRPQIGEIPDVTKPDAGYEAETGKWSPKEPPFYMDGKGYGDPITQDTVFTFTYGVKATYAMVASENAEHTIGDGKNAVFTFKRNIDDEKTYGKFKTALMDGKAMPAGSHTTKEGSLILTLNNTYLDTLSAEKHTVTVKFEDGEAQATVTIKEAPPVPKTGDEANPALWIGLMLLGLIGISGMAVTRKRSRR